MEKSENWYKQFTEKLELSGMSPRTQESYSRAVRLLKDYCNKDPDEITEKDVQSYLLYRKNTSKWAPSRYVFKVAISDYRIIKVQNRRVYFKYTNRETAKTVITSLDVLDFIQKYLLHVLPSGFMKVRYYGFMHTSFFIDFDELRIIVEGFNSVINRTVEKVQKKVDMTCSLCGKSMKFLYSILPDNTRIRGSTFT